MTTAKKFIDAYNEYFVSNLQKLTLNISRIDNKTIQNIKAKFGDNSSAMSFPGVYRSNIDIRSTSVKLDKWHYHVSNIYNKSKYYIKKYWYKKDVFIVHTDGTAGFMSAMLPGQFSATLNLHYTENLYISKTPASLILPYIMRRCTTYEAAVKSIMKLTPVCDLSIHLVKWDGDQCTINMSANLGNDILSDVNYSTTYTGSKTLSLCHKLNEVEKEKDITNMLKSDQTAYSVVMKADVGDISFV